MTRRPGCSCGAGSQVSLVARDVSFEGCRGDGGPLEGVE